MKRPESLAVTNPARFPGSRSEEPIHYVSFIVRCWQDSEAHLRARLVDVNSGVSYPVANLNGLPAVLRRLLHSVFVPAEGSDNNSTTEKGEC